MAGVGDCPRTAALRGGARSGILYQWPKRSTCRVMARDGRWRGGCAGRYRSRRDRKECEMAAPTTTDAPLAIVGARLIDGLGGDPLDDATLIVEGARIRAVGARTRVAVPRDARVIEAAGRTLIPGLIDCHVHLGFPAGFNL